MKAIKNNRPGQNDAAGFILWPGINPLDTPEKVEQWEKVIKSNKVVALKFQPSDRYPKGELQMVEVEGDVKPPEELEPAPEAKELPAPPIPKDPPKVAKSVETKPETANPAPKVPKADKEPLRPKKMAQLETCEDAEELASWLESETDTTVKKAIRLKIESLGG